MRFNRKLFYIAVLTLVFSGCNFDIDVDDDRDKYREPKAPYFIYLSGTVDPNIGGGRRPGDRILVSAGKEGIDDRPYTVGPGLPYGAVRANGEWGNQGIESFAGQKEIWFAIAPEAGGWYEDKDTYNTANLGSNLFINRRGVLVAVKSMIITANNRDISNINVGSIALDTVRIKGAWRMPTMRPDQGLLSIKFYSDEECTQLVFSPYPQTPYSTDEWEMLAPSNPVRTLYVGLLWYNTSDSGFGGIRVEDVKTFPTGISFSTADTGTIDLTNIDISGL